MPDTATRSLRRFLALTSVSALAALGLIPAVPAAACACGVTATPGGESYPVLAETATIVAREGSQDLYMSLNFSGLSDETGLVIPTPNPAKVTVAPDTIDQETRRITAPEYRESVHFFPRNSDGAVESPSPAEVGAPEVLERTRLGPLEATTIRAKDSSGLRDWLEENDYSIDSSAQPILEEYVAKGWDFMALKLVGDEPLSTIDTLRFSFDSDEVVYPMRLSSNAGSRQLVRVTVVSETRMDPTDPTGSRGELTFAGRVSLSSIRDQDARDALEASLGSGPSARPYVTSWRWNGLDPAAITSDFAFSPAPEDDYREVIVNSQLLSLAGIPLGYVLIGVGVVVVAGAAVGLSVAVGLRSAARQRRPT